MRALILSALIAATPVVAAPVVATPTAAAPMQAEAAGRLVTLLASNQMLTELAGRLFETHVRAGTGLDAEQKALFAANPGLKQHVADAVRPELIAILRGELPALRKDLTAIVDEGMNAREIADTTAFLRTATGRKMLARIYQSIGSAAVTNEQQAREVAVTALMASLGPEDYGPMLQFAGTPAAQKLQGLQPRISAAARTWAERGTERHQARVARLVDSATQDFLKRKGKRG